MISYRPFLNNYIVIHTFKSKEAKEFDISIAANTNSKDVSKQKNNEQDHPLLESIKEKFGGDTIR